MRILWRAGAPALAALLGAGAARGGDLPRGLSSADWPAAAIVKLGATADWVAIAPDAVWVGSTGPYAVHRIDPRTNSVTARVDLSGEPCAGLAVGRDALWVPLCGTPAHDGQPAVAGRLARIDLRTQALTLLPVAPSGEEGGVAVGPEGVFLPLAAPGTLARIDPATGTVAATIRVPAGSENPRYFKGRVWITRVTGAEITAVDARTGRVLAQLPTGPAPRFLAAGAGSVWTLNQGDGSMTEIDAAGLRVRRTIALGTPGHGGDVAFGAGSVWTTVSGTPLSRIDAATGRVLCQWRGPGGDSLNVAFDAVWITDYHGGTVTRLPLADLDRQCPPGAGTKNAR
jgi:hypothetical protein